jgi:putative transposase
MAWMFRIYYDHAVYHITIRGNNRQEILKVNSNKRSFLATVSKFKKRFGFKLYAFVLMDNHAHLVLEATMVANISKVMQAIALSYSQKFRRKYGYTGYVWQGRFKSNVIENEKYISKCIDYVHDNPVRAKMVEHPGDYMWSSYHYYSGKNNLLDGIIEIDTFNT